MTSRTTVVRYDDELGALAVELDDSRYVLVAERDWARVQALIGASARVDAAYDALAEAFPDAVAFERIVRAG